MALGLRFAGSADEGALQAILAQHTKLKTLTQLDEMALGVDHVRTCATVMLVAGAMVRQPAH